MADKSTPGDEAPADKPICDHEFFLALAAKGKDEWNKWRRDPKNKDVRVTFKDVDFSEAPRDEIDFSGFEFGDDADFSKCRWRGARTTGHAAFVPGCARFTGAHFGNGAFFNGTTFGSLATFEYAIFGYLAIFSNANFGGWASFDHALLNDGASFDKTSFGDLATFTNATFGIGADLTNAIFANQANFADAEFRGKVNFTRAALVAELTLLAQIFVTRPYSTRPALTGALHSTGSVLPS